jgi:hypothetical protein
VLENNENVVVCGSVFQIIDTETVIKAPEHHEEIKIALLKDACIGHPTAMIRTSTLIDNKINYNTAYEPAEDYDLWVRLSRVGLLHNIQEVLLLYRVHANQVSITKKEIQRKSASKSRFNMLAQLGFDYSEKEKQAYIKQFSFSERLNFNELKMLISFKQKVIQANTSGYYKSESLNEILRAFELENINQYFKANKCYSPKMISQYFKICNLTDSNFSFLEKLKLALKAMLFFKK